MGRINKKRRGLCGHDRTFHFTTMGKKKIKGNALAASILAQFGLKSGEWDLWSVPYQDAVLQESMVYKDEDRKCECRVCGRQTIFHIGANGACPTVSNSVPLDKQRVIDLCGQLARDADKIVSKGVLTELVAKGVSPYVAQTGPVSYNRPHYELQPSRKKRATRGSGPKPEIDTRIVDVFNLLQRELEAARKENQEIRAALGQVAESITTAPPPLPARENDDVAPAVHVAAPAQPAPEIARALPPAPQAAPTALRSKAPAFPPRARDTGNAGRAFAPGGALQPSGAPRASAWPATAVQYRLPARTTNTHTRTGVNKRPRSTVAGNAFQNDANSLYPVLRPANAVPASLAAH
jgi:hypothetical protein